MVGESEMRMLDGEATNKKKIEVPFQVSDEYER